MRVIFDTVIHYKYLRQLLEYTDARDTFYSLVVIHELIAGAADESEVDLYTRLRIKAKAVNRPVVPNIVDWTEAGKILYRLRHGGKSYRKGFTLQKITTEHANRVLRDVMIARTAVRVGALIITENIRDFEEISYFSSVKYASPKDFFNL